MNTIDLVTFNGYVETVDTATGKDIKPFLISIRVVKERFSTVLVGPDRSKGKNYFPEDN